MLANDKYKQIFIDYLSDALGRLNIKIYGYVIIPEHVHLVLHPEDNIKLGVVIGRIKGSSSKKILSRMRRNNSGLINELKVKKNQRFVGAFWQKRCYDHNCRTPEAVIEKINYCHMNPVKRGLVRDPAEWPWSSYNWYSGIRDVSLKIDNYKLF